MDLNAVEMFVSVVQAGSLSAAASRIKIPLPTLSRRLRELERQLNVQLFERSARGVKLTDAGIRLYEHAAQGVEALLEGERAVTSNERQLKGRLRLSLPPSFEPWWKLLATFQRCYPDIQLHVFVTDRRVDLFEDGIDVALRVGAIAHENMVARRILSYRHVLVASPVLVDRLGEPRAPEDLHDYPCAVWRRGANVESAWQLGEHVFVPRPRLSTNDYALLLERALAGEVVTELPPFMVDSAVQERKLFPLLPGYPMPEQQVNLIYPPHRHPSAIVRTYLDFCQAQALRFLGA